MTVHNCKNKDRRYREVKKESLSKQKYVRSIKLYEHLDYKFR